VPVNDVSQKQFVELDSRSVLYVRIEVSVRFRRWIAFWRKTGQGPFLVCPYSQIPRRGLLGWELAGFATVARSTWGCRRCNSLRYASEGWALVIRSRGAFAQLIERQFGRCCTPRPELWLPYVFTSPEEAGEAGVL
jgi:hypothetical protein